MKTREELLEELEKIELDFNGEKWNDFDLGLTMGEHIYDFLVEEKGRTDSDFSELAIFLIGKLLTETNISCEKLVRICEVMTKPATLG